MAAILYEKKYNTIFFRRVKREIENVLNGLIIALNTEVLLIRSYIYSQLSHHLYGDTSAFVIVNVMHIEMLKMDLSIEITLDKLFFDDFEQATVKACL